MIGNNPSYEFVGVFADFGISGTTDNRPEFKRMIELANNGKVDLIITKSISRFARNTAVMLQTVRELKNIGVEVKFEKENISTMSGDGELMLTVLASFAQEESKNISDNVKWRIRNDFKRGKIMLNTKRFLGYDKLDNGELVINEMEAEIVRSIFNFYLKGNSTTKIAKLLTNKGITTLTVKEKWQPSSINNILKNEKYKGDVLCQKTYTPNHLSPGTILNEGKVEQYYIKGHHEPIVTEDEWNRVQDIMEENRQKKNIIKSNKYHKRYPYSGILYCGKCGAKLKRRVWNSNNPSRKVVWQCSNYIKNGAHHCPGISIVEDTLNKAAINGETVIKEEIKNGKKYYRYTAKVNMTNLAEKLEPKQKRMAAYCRVSTDQVEQLSSYEAQVNYYTNFINGHPDYEMAGIYADEGISGTNTKKRGQFLKMIEDCKKGKIDMIITKSISRFARNTLDCLNYVRQLKELGIGILFEKENINTLDSKGEVLLSILSSLAQDESRSISENSTGELEEDSNKVNSI